MSKTGRRLQRATSYNGFTLMEVMVAIGILAISLVAIFNVQATSIVSAGRVKNITAATLLAQSKMIDLELELAREGFSDFAEESSGNFEEEGWPDFRWRATISKVKIPLPGAMPSGEDSNQYANMMAGYTSMITDMISNALRECVLIVEWEEGKSTHEIQVATHFVETGRAGMLQSTSSATGTSGGTK